ncbi:sorbosone dehydrogenase family protein [Methylocapsa sp. S129]|uniref:PQQ-dependent sugar dehydrogenase n=1 Tax=Methylocapsa sp. S129 TaxID=1641869 RepID=UPI00131CE432|nr:sorbosone dehydrogenase family protein [Methylocapsa sp. S129]
MRVHIALAGLVALACASSGAPRPALAENGAALVGAAAYGDWRSDAPGVRRKLTPADMPAPMASRPAANPSRVVVQPAGATPKVPPGFTVSVFAKDLTQPRVVRIAPNGDIFVAESAAGRVRVLRAADSAAAVSRSEIFAASLNRPFGVAFYPPGPNPTYVYVATNTQVVRFPYRSGDLKASAPPEIIVPSLPGGPGHWTRDIVFSPDGKTMFVSVGSGSNVAEKMAPLQDSERASFEANHALGAAWGPEENRADVLAFDPDGRNMRVYAAGIRNCSGLTIQPESAALWCVVNERDILGDDLPPEYATAVKEGGFYGWPWYYIGAHEDPRHKGERTDLADKITVPDVLIQPHSAPLGVTFYEAAQFPADYKGDAFVALHGSWNRANRTGYKVVRLLFKDGKPTGEYEDFLTGFVADDASVWGRPVDVAVTRDGSLLVTDDGGGVIWRVAYKGP